MPAASRGRRRPSRNGTSAVRRTTRGLPSDGLDPIVEAAAMLFESRGYDETTVAQVAERAGVGRQTVHACYGGKPGLLAAIVVEFCGGFVRHVLRWSAAGCSGRLVEGHPTGLVQLAAAMRDYAALRGPLARVALAARDLPWLALPTASARRELEQLLVYHLGGAPRSRMLLCFCTEVLACVARHDGRRESGPIDEPDWQRVAAVLPELAAALAPAERQAG